MTWLNFATSHNPLAAAMRSLIVLLPLLASQAFPVFAQSDPGGAYYIVQEGDTLNAIALRFDVSTQDIIDANQIADPDLVSPGTRLLIPGIEGVSGQLEVDYARLGDTFTSLCRRYGLSPSILAKLNDITSPGEIYAGSPLILTSSDASASLNGVSSLRPDESPLELAVRQGINPWSLTEPNLVDSAWSLLPGEQVYFPSDQPRQDYSSVSPLFTAFDIEPLPVRQGSTLTIRIQTREPLDLSGDLSGYTLHFVQTGEYQYLALQGIHAMAEPGITALSLSGQTSSGETFSLVQNLMVLQGYFIQDPPLTVDPATLDPANTGPEDELVKGIVAAVTPEKHWDGLFLQPVDDPACIFSTYGNRRSYNGSEYRFFHTGVDYGVCANLNIYAPAPGRVVFSGPLAVRGNATIIDHGWGVFSGIWHQSNSFVQEGDWVEAGELIGEIGATGRVTGPHLHWEVFVGGVQVQPLDWLDIEYPPPVLNEVQN